MRSFTCYDCGHRFQVAYGVGGRGGSMTCPGCGSRNVHRAEHVRGFDRVGRAGGVGGVSRGGSLPGRGPRWARCRTES